MTGTTDRWNDRAHNNGKRRQSKQKNLGCESVLDRPFIPTDDALLYHVSKLLAPSIEFDRVQLRGLRFLTQTFGIEQDAAPRLAEASKFMEGTAALIAEGLASLSPAEAAYQDQLNEKWRKENV